MFMLKVKRYLPVEKNGTIVISMKLATRRQELKIITLK